MKQALIVAVILMVTATARAEPEPKTWEVSPSLVVCQSAGTRAVIDVGADASARRLFQGESFGVAVGVGLRLCNLRMPPSHWGVLGEIEGRAMYRPLGWLGILGGMVLEGGRISEMSESGFPVRSLGFFGRPQLGVQVDVERIAVEAAVELHLTDTLAQPLWISGVVAQGHVSGVFRF